MIFMVVKSLPEVVFIYRLRKTVDRSILRTLPFIDILLFDPV